MYDNINELQIWYLFHSGFAIKTPDYFLIFDYYLDHPEGLHAVLNTGVINPEEIRDLEVVVFSSHQHSDHFNPVILNWSSRIKNIHYILSYDIEAVKDGQNILSVRPGSEYDVQGLHVSVFDSTDIGVSFLVEVNGFTIFHAGDLNWWHWEGEPDEDNMKMAEDYKRQINLLKSRHIDIAFIPVDPRLEDQYLWGLDYFMNTVGSEFVFPMHFGNDYTIFERLKKDKLAEKYIERTVEITHRGQVFFYRKG